MKKWLIALALFGVGALAFFQIISLADLSWDPFLAILLGVDPPMVLVTLVLLALVFLCAALKWKIITEIQSDAARSTFFYFRYVTLAVAVGQVFPLTLCNASVRAYALKRKEGHGVLKTTGLFLWDQAFDFMALGLLVCIGVIRYLGNLSFLSTALAALCIWAVIVGLMPVLTTLLVKVITWLCSKSWIPARVRDMLGHLLENNLLHANVARKLFSLGMVKYVTSAAVYTCIFALYGLGYMAFDIYWSAPTAEMAGVLSQMPGGLGALDWTWVGALTANGLDAKAAATAVLGMRFLLICSYLTLTLFTWGPHLVRRFRG